MRWAPIAVVCVVVVLSALVLNAWRVGEVTRPATARDGGRLIETRIATANVKTEGEGAAIVLIHGFGAALDWWDAIAPDLARDRKVIRLDLIGHGGTEAPRSGYAIERQAALVRAVLDSLGVSRAVVVGHSMGGEVAVAFTAGDPDRVERLVLIDTPPNPERSFSLPTRAAFTPLIGQALWPLRTDNVLRRGLAQGFAPGFPVPEAFIADFRRLTYTAFRKAHENSVAYVSRQHAPERLANLVSIPPLLVIFGTEDALIPVEGAKQFGSVPGAELVMIPGAGHSPMVEKPAETLRAIRRFLAAKNETER